MIGVDYDLFWTLNPKSLIPFVEAFKLKQQMQDVFAWEIGAYVRDAIASNFSKTHKYPHQPHSMDLKAKEMPQEIIKERFLRDVSKINKKFK